MFTATSTTRHFFAQRFLVAAYLVCTLADRIAPTNSDRALCCQLLPPFRDSTRPTCHHRVKVDAKKPAAAQGAAAGCERPRLRGVFFYGPLGRLLRPGVAIATLVARVGRAHECRTRGLAPALGMGSPARLAGVQLKTGGSPHCDSRTNNGVHHQEGRLAKGVLLAFDDLELDFLSRKHGQGANT